VANSVDIAQSWVRRQDIHVLLYISIPSRYSIPAVAHIMQKSINCVFIYFESTITLQDFNLAPAAKKVGIDEEPSKPQLLQIRAGWQNAFMLERTLFDVSSPLCMQV
jgi:hypothetical protein